MLDPVVEESRREALADETRKLIESQGELKHADNWGMRKMAYEIEQRTEADYRFYRFVAANPLLEQLDHTLKIADGALRFRVFRVDPRTSASAPPAASAPHVSSSRHSRDAEPEPAAEAPAEPVAETPDAPAEAPATEAAEAPAEAAAEAPAEGAPETVPDGETEPAETS